MNKSGKDDTIMIFLIAFLAFGIMFTLIFMVELVWQK